MPSAGQVIKPMVKLGKDPEACWSWLGCKRSRDGLALKQIAGRQVTARRWIWEQLFGPIPDGMVIAQKCGKQDCINPHHLRMTNLADALRAGATATLTDGDVRDIRAKRGTGVSAKALAKDYEVSPQTIRDIWRGDTWKTKTKAPAAVTPSIRMIGASNGNRDPALPADLAGRMAAHADPLAA